MVLLDYKKKERCQKSMEMAQNLFENVIATLEGKSSGLCPVASSAWKMDTLQEGVGYNNGKHENKTKTECGHRSILICNV